MIKSHEGQLSIEGNRTQILLDFAHIYEAMIRISPEIVQAVVMSKEKELLDAKVDKTGFAICEKILDNIIFVKKRG